MNSPPTIARLWDYGWLAHDIVGLPAASSDPELIQAYVASAAFHTSFLPNDKDETGIHGPFLASHIHADDFMPLALHALDDYLQSVQFADSAADDAMERGRIAQHLKPAFTPGRRCFILRRDERDTQLFHDWGWVLFLFREFLFSDPQRDHLERFIIGCD